MSDEVARAIETVRERRRHRAYIAEARALNEGDGGGRRVRLRFIGGPFHDELHDVPSPPPRAYEMPERGGPLVGPGCYELSRGLLSGHVIEETHYRWRCHLGAEDMAALDRIIEVAVAREDLAGELARPESTDLVDSIAAALPDGHMPGDDPLTRALGWAWRRKSALQVAAARAAGSSQP